MRLRFIGDRGRFDRDIQGDLAAAERDTAANTRLNLTVALSYGRAGRDRRGGAGRRPRRHGPGGSIRRRWTRRRSAACSSTAGMPDPDLIIRTSGEQRLSNFLLWQAAYAELVFLDVLWPDFGAEHFAAALADYRRPGAAVWCPAWLSRCRRTGSRTSEALDERCHAS